MLIPLLFGVTDETPYNSADKVDQHLNSARLDDLGNNAGIGCFIALSK